MRVASPRQHVQHQPRTHHHHNGKFLLSPSSSPEHVAQHHYLQQHQQPLAQLQIPQHFVHHQHQQQQFQIQRQAGNGGDDASSTGGTQQQQQQQQQFASYEPSATQSGQEQGPTILGDRFLLVGPAEGSTLYRCVDTLTGQQLVAKAVTMGERSTDALLQAHLRLEGSGAASGVAGLVDAGKSKRYLLLDGHHGDLHAYVRARRRLREPEARRLFKQAARAVATCHEHGVVLRDLKLRKFVFADEARTKLRLESLEDAVLVGESDDRLSDRRGCPAYVAPEVLRSGRAYSGKAADMWSLGVLLYTMLVGRYPFNDAEHASLFAKISRGHFAVPDALSPRARCLVRALLRREPSERPLADDVLRHPWLSRPLRQQTLHSPNLTSNPAGSGPAGAGASSSGGGQAGQQGCHQARSPTTATPDQMVPEISFGGQD